METKVKAMAIVRLIVPIILSINSLLIARGLNPIPFDENLFVEVTAYIVNGLSLFWAWWKDNDITKKARQRKATANAIANGEISVTEAENIAEADDVEDDVDAKVVPVEELETEYEMEVK